MEALNVLRDESICRRLDRHTLVAILDKDVMHIIVVARDVEPIRLPDMVRNDLTTTSGAGGERRQRLNLHVMDNVIVPHDRQMKPSSQAL